MPGRAEPMGAASCRQMPDNPHRKPKDAYSRRTVGRREKCVNFLRSRAIGSNIVEVVRPVTARRNLRGVIFAEGWFRARFCFDYAICQIILASLVASGCYRRGQANGTGCRAQVEMR